MGDFSPAKRKVLDHIRETDGWRLLASGELRRPKDGGRGVVYCCPISSLDDVDDYQYRWVAKRHGIGMHAADLIAATADRARGYDPALRVAMLEAAGLEEA